MSINSIPTIASNPKEDFNLTKSAGPNSVPYLEIGYDNFLSNYCVVGKWGIEPFTMLDWVSNWEHGFREHGGGDLNMIVKKRYSSFLRSETGLRFHENCNVNWGQIVFLEKPKLPPSSVSSLKFISLNKINL